MVAVFVWDTGLTTVAWIARLGRIATDTLPTSHTPVALV